MHLFLPLNLFMLPLMGIVVRSSAQQDTLSSDLRISMELRPRSEFRDGYKKMRTDSSEAAFFTDQRSRLNLDYRIHPVSFHVSLQDVRVWGGQDPRSATGTLQLFEAYAEPLLSKRFSIRIGRQRIVYDNQRLFSENNWNQAGRSHDAVRMIYTGPVLATDLVAAYNQNPDASGHYSGTKYDPGFSEYKVLLAHFLKWKLTNKVTLSTINAADAYQDVVDGHTTHFRFTSGGRIEGRADQWYFTLAGYYQYGRHSEGRAISAFYLQPEIDYTQGRFDFRLGAELFSGDDARDPSETLHSFEPLYGSNHRFLGSMDYFTRYPGDFAKAGIIAPYFFSAIRILDKLSIHTDEYLFYSQNHLAAKGSPDPFLGFENDLLLVWKPNTITEVQLGYSWILPTASMEIIQQGGDHELWQNWAFVMVTFKPELLRWVRK